MGIPHDIAVNGALRKLQQASIDLKPIVEELKDVFDKASSDPTVEASKLAEMLLLVTEVHQEIDKSVKIVYGVKDRMNKHVMPTRMEEMGVDMLRIPELGRSFSRQQKMSATFVDKERGFDWLREIGQGDLITETVNAGTLTSFCRNLILEEGIDPPEDAVRVTSYYATGINKYTPK